MKVLLVEDDRLLRELAARALDTGGHETVAVANGNDAIEKVRDHAFDLIITDIFMPDKEGLEVIQEVREIHPNIKIMAISAGGAAGHTSFLKIAEAFGANTSLQKPFTVTQLLEKVGELEKM